MNFTIFKGLITGLILSLPFGPIGIYCMEKTITEGQRKGYISAMGMVTVDIIYSFIALFFISKVESTIRKYELLLQIFIGIFLIVIGWKKFYSKEQDIKEIDCNPTSIIKDYMTTFILALANISGIFSIVVIFTTLKVYEDIANSATAFNILLGVLLGGGTEWFITTFILSHFTRVLDENKIFKLSKLSGILIFVFGLVIILLAILAMFHFNLKFIK